MKNNIKKEIKQKINKRWKEMKERKRKSKVKVKWKKKRKPIFLFLNHLLSFSQASFTILMKPLHIFSNVVLA